jgi:hypothetical protein
MLASSEGRGKPLEGLITFVVLESYSSRSVENRLKRSKVRYREMARYKCR